MKKDLNQQPTADFTRPYPVFTPEMKATHTILIPDMLPWHFDLLVHVMRREGYRVEVLNCGVDGGARDYDIFKMIPCKIAPLQPDLISVS